MFSRSSNVRFLGLCSHESSTARSVSVRSPLWRVGAAISGGWLPVSPGFCSCASLVLVLAAKAIMTPNTSGVGTIVLLLAALWSMEGSTAAMQHAHLQTASQWIQFYVQLGGAVHLTALTCA